MTPKPARVLAWMTFAVGVVVSVLGNIGHAASDGMQPGEWAGAAFWPVALLLSIEVLVRVRWQPEKRWTFARFFGLLVVSVVAAVLSYLHLRSLLIFWGYGKFQGSIGPLAVDGLMLIAASALLSISKEQPVPEATTPVYDKPRGSAAVVEIVPDVRDEEIRELVDELFPDGVMTPTEKPKPKVQTSKTVPTSATEEAAFQIWVNATPGEKPSVRQLAAQVPGLSPSKAHRLITSWKGLEAATR